MKQRDYNILSVIRRESKGYISTVGSKKAYTRKIKHKSKHDEPI